MPCATTHSGDSIKATRNVSVLEEVVILVLMTTQPSHVTAAVPRDHTSGEPDQDRQKILL